MSASASPDRNPVDYTAAQEAQRILAAKRREDRVGDLLWLVEHPPTITWGSAGGRDHVLVPAEELQARGIALCRSDRGGDVTFHEPGQLVGYPIVDLGAAEDRDLYVYLRRVEGAIILYLADTGIAATRVEGRTGVWVQGAAGSPPRKIAAMGVRARRWITSHGFALNVENALGGFGSIVPCGIQDAGVTSMARELEGNVPSWEEVSLGVHRHLERQLERSLQRVVGTEGLRLAGL
jgi:lipoyl(octanoyl) transferase